jgi:hypothetical protein
VALLGGLMALATATALAGGMATATISAGDEPPTAGEEREVRAVLLQHGVDPVDEGRVTISAWLPGTTERLDVPATSVGGGEWVAAMTFPVEGEWRIQVHHGDLLTPAPLIFPVASATTGGLPPAVIPLAGMVAAMTLVGVWRLLAARRRPAAPAEAGLREPARAG